MEEITDEQKLQSFLSQDDIIIPNNRKQDVFWLLRNFAIKNKDHKDFNTIMSLIRSIALKRLRKNK